MSKFSIKFQERLREEILEECRKRNLPAALDLGKAGWGDLCIVEHCHTRRTGHLMLLGAEGWAKYSRRWMSAMGWNGVRRELKILGGKGADGSWAARVPATINGVMSAIEWLQPARVRHAAEAKRLVWRQGDVWIVQRVQGLDDDLRQLPSSHTWNASSRVLQHEQHQAIHIPWAWAAIPQRTLARDGRRRRRGD